VIARSPVAVFDRQGIAGEDHRYAMERVTVPRRGLARCKAQSSDQRRSSPVKGFFDHSLRSLPVP